MPTYDYQCRSCGHTVEVIHAMTADGPTTCEVCGGPLRRVLFPAGIIFKGSGFYRNDARASNAATTTPSTRTPSESASSTPASSGGEAGGGTSSAEKATPTKPAPSPASD